ncbi:hypothetical protein Dimus_024020 [Dionaea muscipula]
MFWRTVFTCAVIFDILWFWKLRFTTFTSLVVLSPRLTLLTSLVCDFIDSVVLIDSCRDIGLNFTGTNDALLLLCLVLSFERDHQYVRANGPLDQYNLYAIIKLTYTLPY